MNTRLRTLLVLSLAVGGLLAPARHAEATWSVLAVDQKTGTVIIASATCVPSAALKRMAPAGLMGVQAIVVPGRGVAAAQAAVDGTFANQKLIYAELQKGTPPADIMRLLTADERFTRRQYAILDLQGQMAQHSGSDNGRFSLHEGGALPDNASILYSVQGNILMSEAVVHAAARAFREASGTLADRVMAAMEAADREGGDSRCSCDNPRNPEVAAPCTDKTAHVAYILQADKSDAPGESFNDGKYTMYISATDADIKPEEDANPVRTLRMRYEAWKRRQGA
jgi:uncharacterized Ntn-hydrolase superfamily protein